jgi:hypothetical protein
MNNGRGPSLGRFNRPDSQTALTGARCLDITNIVLPEKVNFVMLLDAYREGFGDGRFVTRFIKMAGDVK